MKGYAFRYTVIVLAMLLAAFTVSARVTYIHVYQSDALRLEAERHQKRNIPLYSYRGTILDRQGRELAVSAPSVSIWGDPSDLLSNMDALSDMSRRIGLDFFALKSRIERAASRTFIYVKRQVSPEVMEHVRGSGIEGIGFISERKRVYPEGAIFSHVVGVTDVDGRGVEGVELVFDEHLRGRDGVKSVVRDSLGRSFEVVDVPEPRRDGKDVVLSLDRNIQYISYSELGRAITHHDADRGMMVVLDVEQGKILSLVNLPAYNPNERSNLVAGNLRNRMVTDIFEPGSAIKPFIVSAALEEGVVVATDIIDVSPGHIEINNKKIRDSANYGRLGISEIIAKSSNVGLVRISERVSNDFLAEKLRDYGLFSHTGSELPGEAAGIFRSSNEWSRYYKPFLSFGYGAAVNGLQLANAYMVIANRGVRRDISILRDAPSAAGYRVMSAPVADMIKQMLGQVVSKEGTGRQAATSLYTIAGKTGTAKKNRSGGYQDDAYMAVFCGMAPVENPRIVVAIIIDNPRKNGFYGGQVAAPVFSRVASRVLRYMDVLPDRKIADLAQGNAS